MPEIPPLFPVGHVRSTPIPDALLPFSATSEAEQMRRVHFVLEALERKLRRRSGALASALTSLARQCCATSAATARRLLQAIARTTDLHAWERTVGRCAVTAAIQAAKRHCAVGKRRWLKVAP